MTPGRRPCRIRYVGAAEQGARACMFLLRKFQKIVQCPKGFKDCLRLNWFIPWQMAVRLCFLLGWRYPRGTLRNFLEDKLSVQQQKLKQLKEENKGISIENELRCVNLGINQKELHQQKYMHRPRDL